MWILLVNNRVHQIKQEKPDTESNLNWIKVKNTFIEPEEGFYYKNGWFIPNKKFSKQKESWIVNVISDTVEDWGDSSDYHNTVKYFEKFFRKFPILNAFIYSYHPEYINLLNEFTEDNGKWSLSRKYMKRYSSTGLGFPRSILFKIYEYEGSFFEKILAGNRFFAENLHIFSCYLFGDIDIPSFLKDGVESYLWDFIKNYGNSTKWSQFFYRYPLALTFIFVDCKDYFYNELNRAKVLGSPFSVKEIEKMKKDLGYEQGLQDTKLLDTRYPRGPI